MKNYQIEFILKLQNGNSYSLQQQIINVDAKNKKEALQIGKSKLYIPKYFISIDNIEFI
jgi:hypothetical protein